MAAPLMALSVPLLDAGLTIARRFVRQKPIFRADRSHIHHKLLSRGLTPRRVVLILYGFCGLAAAASLMLTAMHERYQGLIVVLVCLIAVVGLQNLGYNEFSVAGKLALDGTIGRLLSAQFSLIAFEKELQAATTPQQCWEVLCHQSPQFGLYGSRLHLHGIVRKGEVVEGWVIRIDFPDHGYINLARKHGDKNSGAAVLFIDSISRVLTKKLDEWQSESEESRYVNAD